MKFHIMNKMNIEFYNISFTLLFFHSIEEFLCIDIILEVPLNVQYHISLLQIQYAFIVHIYEPRIDVGSTFNLFMKFDARDFQWGTSLSKRVYRLIFLLYFHRIRLLYVLLVASLSDYALIEATHSACPLWFIECGRNKRNNLITDFSKE